MGLIINIYENQKHEIAELMCLACKGRYIATYPQSTPLKYLTCECGATGLIIKTGQTIESEDL